MAINKLENATYAVSTSWEDETKSKNILKKGHYKVQFPTLNTTSNVPYVMSGSSVDVDGVIYEFDSNMSTGTTEGYVAYDTGDTLGWTGDYGRGKIVWDGSRYVSIGKDGSRVRISVDGINWVTIPSNLATGAGALLAYEPDTETYIVAYGSDDVLDPFGGGQFVTVYTSTDLINWTKRLDEMSLPWNPIDIAAGNGMVAIITWETFVYSTDFASWTKTANATATAGDNIRITFCPANNTFFFTDYDDGIISTTDGTTFTKTTIDLPDPNPQGFTAVYTYGIDWNDTLGLIVGCSFLLAGQLRDHSPVQIEDPDTPGDQNILGILRKNFISYLNLWADDDAIYFENQSISVFFKLESPWTSGVPTTIPGTGAAVIRARDASQPGRFLVTAEDEEDFVAIWGLTDTPPTESDSENYLILDDNSGSPQLEWTDEPPIWDAERNGYYYGSTKRALLKCFYDGTYYWGLVPLAHKLDADENSLGFKMKSLSGTISESDLFDAMAPNIPYIGSEMPLFGGTFEYTDTSNGIMEQWLYAKRTASGITVRTCFIVKEQSGDTRVASASRYRNLNIWYPSIAPPFEDLEIAWYDVVHLPPDE